MKDEREALEIKWRRCMMTYLCEHDKAWVQFAKDANRSHRYVALNWDAIETLLPQVYDSVFGQDDYLKIRPMREGFNEDDDQVAEMMKYLLRYQMMHGKYKQTAKIGMKQLLMLGNCPWTMQWVVRKAVNYGNFVDAMKKWVKDTAQYQREYEDIMMEYNDIAIQSRAMGQDPPPPPTFKEPARPPKDMSVVFEGPVLRVSSIFNFVQEQHPNDEASALRIIRSWRTLAYLKQMAKPGEDGYKLYENLSSVQEIASEDRSEDNSSEHLLKMALGMTMPTGKNKVQLKEMHGTFEINGPGGEKGLYENYICTVANNELIRCEPSPMFSGRPLVQNARLITIEGGVYGIGVIEKALDEQDSAVAIHNQNIDAVASIISPECEVVEDQLVDGEAKPSGPGVRHYVTQVGTFNAIPKNFQGVPLGFESLNACIRRHERITGSIDTGSGNTESATKTARNTNVIATKLGGHVEQVELDFIGESLNAAMELNAQYIDDNQKFSITQDERVLKLDISPEHIRRGWLVFSAGSKYMAEKQARLEKLMMTLQMATQSEASGKPSPVRMDNLWRKLFKEALGEADDLLMSKEEYEAALQQYQMMIQAQQLAATRTAIDEATGPPAPAAGAPDGASGAPVGPPAA
jgi:hypothetical protein